MYLADIYTVSANIAGLPAISVPCGTIEAEGKKLPVGLQLMGKWFDEETLLNAAYIFEQSK
jgi:aspartyl-tRNA(Asn)/glutamyl-tRNA(Gln) amidotransferase subunit A